MLLGRFISPLRLLALAATVAATPAAAINVHFDLGGVHSAQFTIAEEPTPASFTTGDSFVLTKVAGTFDGIAGVKSIQFYNDAFDGGFSVLGDFGVGTAQLYFGGEATPQIYSGDYSVTDRTTGDSIGGLVVYETSLPVGGVPEPAAWALMIGGFGLVGAAMRVRAAVA